MFGWEFPPNISGGLGTACYGLTKGLLALQDVEITFVVPKVFGDEDRTNLNLIGAEDVTLVNRRKIVEKYNGLIRSIEVSSKLVPYVDPEEYSHQTDYTVEGIKTEDTSAEAGRIKFSGTYGPDLMTEIAEYALIADRIAQDNSFDLIHAHDWLAYPAGIVAKRVSGKPLVIHVHATDFDRSGGDVNPMVYAIEKEGMEVADRIITVSNLTKSIVIEKYGISPDKVITVHNAVEPYSYSTNNQPAKGFPEKIVTFLGRITLQKGPEYFIEAAHKVIESMGNVRFVMAGSGDMMNKMVRRAAQLKIADRFHFTGFLKGEEVYRMLRMSDIYIMPSVSEPFGISPLEAMQAGVPVIISRQSGVAEVLNHAIKVDFWDVDAMADAIHGLLSYPAIAKKMARSGRKESYNLKWKDSARKVRQVYISVVLS